MQRLISLFALLLLSSTAASTTSLSRSLYSELSSLIVDIPSINHTLIKNITASGYSDSRVIAASNLTHFLSTEWQHLPEEIKLKFRAATFTESTVFESFSVILNTNDSQLDEFIGAARRYNGKVEIAYLSCTAQGALVAQYETIVVRKCRTCWLFAKCCSTDTETHARGYTLNEFGTITNILRKSAYESLSDVFTTHFLRPVIQIVKPQEKLADRVVKGLVSQLTALKTQIDANRNLSVVVERIVNRGIEDFRQKAYVQQFDNIAYGFNSEFVAWLSVQLSLPERYTSHLSDMVNLVQHAAESEWLLFELAFAVDSGAQCDYAVIIGRNNVGSQSTEWLIGQVASSVTLSPELFIVREKTTSLFGLINHSEDSVYESPVFLTSTDMNVLFDFFNIVIYERFSVLLNVFPRHLLPFEGSIIPEDFSFTNAVGTALQWWPQIVAGFKTDFSSSVLNEVRDNGFAHYKGSAMINEVIDLDSRFVPRYSSMLLEELSVPEDKRPLLMEHLALLPYLKSNEFALYDILFNLGDGGKCKYVTVMMMNNKAEQTTSFLVGDFTATFTLAPDIIVFQKSRSFVGGLYADVSIEFDYKSRSVNQDDIDAVFGFFKLAAVSKFADMVGRPIPIPPQLE